MAPAGRWSRSCSLAGIAAPLPRPVVGRRLEHGRRHGDRRRRPRPLAAHGGVLGSPSRRAAADVVEGLADHAQSATRSRRWAVATKTVVLRTSVSSAPAPRQSRDQVGHDLPEPGRPRRRRAHGIAPVGVERTGTDAVKTIAPRVGRRRRVGVRGRWRSRSVLGRTRCRWSRTDDVSPPGGMPRRVARCACMPVLAIDAGTTGVTALVVGEDGRVAGPRLRGVPAALPAARLGRARARGDLAGHRRRLPRGARAAPTQPPTCDRHHRPARDRGRCGTGGPCTRPAPRDRLAGPAHGRDLRPAARRRRTRTGSRELTGLRLRPLLHRHQARLARREHEPRLWAGRPRRRGRARHRRLLPRRPADRRRRARHRRVQRLAAPCCSTSTRATGPTSCASCSASRGRRCPRSCRRTATSARTDPDAFLGLDLPIAGHRRRPAGRAVRAGLLRRRRLEVHLRHRLVRAHQHRRRAGRARDAGLLTTVAWDIGEALTYALEGAIFVTGAAVQWLRDGLGMIGSAAESRRWRGRCPTAAASSSCRRSPASARPHWDPHARGTIVGITRGTTRAHLVRATLEAIAFEVRDVVE